MTYKTPSGKTYDLFYDMTKQPHLLVAGATGSGKSVVVNGIITTLLYDFPDQAQFILIDPKRVELSKYKKLPHTIYYASEPGDMIKALYCGLQIIEKRYKFMQSRNLRKYNGGHVYIIIDEFADLMTTNRRQVAPLVQRIAQIGRASNVHIILCTQTPIAKVIPTEIKCNFDARVGLRTRSSQDSRNILGVAGLEALPVFGEGVYMTPKGNTLYKIPYVTDEEQDHLVAFWEKQNKKSFLKKIFT